MKMHIRKLFSLLLVIGMGIIATSCTGTRMNVTPSPDSLTSTFPKTYNALAVRELAANRVYPPAGNLVRGFADELERSNLASNIYYPARSGDKVDLTLNSKFDVSMDPHMGYLMLKSFVIGLSLFILEPVFWYDYDYALVGQIDVLKEQNKVDVLKAKTDANIGMKWLSLGKAQTLEGETLGKAKQSLYRQLLESLHKHSARP